METTARDKEKIEKYIKLIDRFSVNANKKEAEEFMANPIKARIYGELDYLYPGISQKEIKDLERNIKSIQAKLKDYIDAVKTGKLTVMEFKEKYIMKEIWAVSEAKKTELWPRIKQTPPNEIFRSMEKMFDAVKNGKTPDELIEIGHLPNIMGHSVLTELLHKYFIRNYPIKNKRSGWGLCLIYDLNPDTILDSNKITYEKFIEYCEKVYVYYKEWMTEKGIKLNDDFKYYYLDRVFESLYSSKRYEEVIKEFYRGKKDNAYF